MKWWKLQAIAIYVMIAGIVMESILRANIIWSVFSFGCLLAFLSEKLRSKQVKNKRRGKK